jgi:hypothetical protein
MLKWKKLMIPQDFFVQIRDVLMKDWDPIGIRDEPGAANEYDNYIPKIYQLLIFHASVSQIQDYLFEIVDERMGMSPPATHENMRPTAEALKELGLTA